jgi:Arc/MetJ family transcription regulator
VYDEDVSRTNVVVDDRLIEKAMRLYGLKTKREAIDFALRRLVGEYEPIDMLDLQGMGWEGDLDELRRDRMRELWSS